MKHLGVLIVMACLVAASAVEIPRIGAILAIGDSITRHGPSEKLGWTGDWGMAASARELDWPHRLQAQIATHQGGVVPELLLDAAGGGRIRDKLARLAQVTAQKADLIVIQLGENENKPELIATFEQDYAALVSALRTAQPAARIICLGVWGGDPRKDALIHRICMQQGAWFAGIAAVCADPANWAKADQRWTHPGVNWHPGDKGMAAYAATVWRVLGAGSDPAPGMQPTQKSGTVVMQEDYTDAAAATERWKGAGSVTDGSWSIALAQAGKAAATTVLPVERLAGHQVRVVARVRGADISVRPKPWNGIKVQLEIVDAEERRNWPQAVVPEGTFAWKEVTINAFVPRNAVRVALNLGLEAVTGTVWFDDVRVEVVDP